MGADGAVLCAGYCQLLGSSPSPLVPEVSVCVRSSPRLSPRQLGHHWVVLDGPSVDDGEEEGGRLPQALQLDLGSCPVTL